MTERTFKICLLGGSNSILCNGLSRGLGSGATLLNLSLGASTALQNIYALTRHHEEIVDSVDVIVTESNVNDAHAVTSAEVPIAQIEDSIRKLYREISLTGKPAIALLIPIGHFKNPEIPEAVAERVHHFHLTHARAYGVDVIDLNQTLSGYTTTNRYSNLIMTHSFHPLESYMYELGLNITAHLKQTVFPSASRSLQSNYTALLPTSFCSDTRRKSNSRYRCDLLDLKAPVTIELTDGKCVAISTWSEGLSELILEGDGVRVVKQFSDQLLFNEFQQTLPRRFTLTSQVGETQGCTEYSMHTLKRQTTPTHPVAIEGFLVEKDVVTEPDTTREGKLITHLFPPADVHIASVSRALENLEILPNPEVLSLIEAANELKKRSPSLALALMEIVAKHRSANPAYKEAVVECRALVKKRKKSLLRFLRR